MMHLASGVLCKGNYGTTPVSQICANIPCYVCFLQPNTGNNPEVTKNGMTDALSHEVCYEKSLFEVLFHMGTELSICPLPYISWSHIQAYKANGRVSPLKWRAYFRGTRDLPHASLVFPKTLPLLCVRAFKDEHLDTEDNLAFACSLSGS